MMDVHSLLKQTKRPKVLMQAARHYAAQLGGTSTGRKTSAERLLTLMEQEKELNVHRRQHAVDYNPARHIRLLAIILLAAEDHRAKVGLSLAH